MSLVSVPQNGLLFRIYPHDGTIAPCDIGGGFAALGPMTLVLTNMGGDAGLPLAQVMATITAAGLPIPFSTSRFVLNWQKLKSAAGAGNSLTASTF